jgi:hypothetical protein
MMLVRMVPISCLTCWTWLKFVTISELKIFRSRS